MPHGMLVCLEGHVIDGGGYDFERTRTPFCADCGSGTIDRCPGCGEYIPAVDSYNVRKIRVPKYCVQCGSPYPWQESAIESLKAITMMENLSDVEKEEFSDAIKDIVRDTPKTQVASLKVKAFLSKFVPGVREVILNLLKDIGTEAALRIITGK